MALLICNYGYDKETMGSELNNVENEESKLKRFFASKYCPFQNKIHEIKNIDKDIDYADYLKEIKNFTNLVKEKVNGNKKVVVFVYYSGHGCIIDGDSHMITHKQRTINYDGLIRKIGEIKPDDE